MKTLPLVVKAVCSRFPKPDVKDSKSNDETKLGQLEKIEEEPAPKPPPPPPPPPSYPKCTGADAGKVWDLVSKACIECPCDDCTVDTVIWRGSTCTKLPTWKKNNKFNVAEDRCKCGEYWTGSECVPTARFDNKCEETDYLIREDTS